MLFEKFHERTIKVLVLVGQKEMNDKKENWYRVQRDKETYRSLKKSYDL